MKQLFLILFLIINILILTAPSLVNSQTSQSQEYRLEQIEKLSATASSKVATISSKTKSPSSSFTSGSVVAIANGVIFLNTKAGTKTIYTSENTFYYNIDSTGKKLIGVGDLKTGDNIDVVGISAQTNSGGAKIVVRDQTKVTKNFSLIGNVLEINATSLKVGSLTRFDLPTITSTLNNETAFANNRSSSLKISDILVNDKIALAGYFDDKGSLITKQVFKISAASNKTATSSAK